MNKGAYTYFESMFLSPEGRVYPKVELLCHMEAQFQVYWELFIPFLKGLNQITFLSAVDQSFF